MFYICSERFDFWYFFLGENSMIKISATIGERQDEAQNKIVYCPECSKILTDVLSVTGSATLRCKCRRCKKYVEVNIKN